MVNIFQVKDVQNMNGSCSGFHEITPITMNEFKWKRAYTEIANVMPTWSAVLEAVFNCWKR